MTERTDRDRDHQERIDRLIALALREPADDALPPAFAVMVAARAEAATQATVDRKDWVIQGTLFACLTLTALVGFGSDFAALLERIAAGTADGAPAALDWSAAIGVCLVLTLLVDIWTRGRHAARYGVAPWSV
jgi:hypothetical protein